MDPEIQRILADIQRIADQGGVAKDILAYLRGSGFSGTDEQVTRQWRVSLNAGRPVPASSPLLTDPTVSRRMELGAMERDPTRSPMTDPAVRTDATRVAPEAEQERVRRAPPTVKDVLRLGAAGALPGVSDEVEGRLYSLSPNLTYEQAVAQARSGLDEARKTQFATLIELAAGLGTGTAIATPIKGVGIVARGARAVQRPFQAVTGLTKGMPQTATAALAQGVRTGIPVGLIAGAGAGTNPDPSMWDRAEDAGIGGVAGGLLGGLFGLGAQQVLSRATRPNLAIDDIIRAFGEDSPEARRAIRELAETSRRGGRTGADVQARLDAAPETPLFEVDALGDAGRVHLRHVDQMAAGTDAAEQAGRTLQGRAQQVPARMAGGVEAASGRVTRAPAAVERALREEKSALDDILFERAREAARQRGPVRATPELKEGLMDPNVQKAVLETREAMETLRRGGRSTHEFVDPYLYRAGKPRTQRWIIGVKNDLDPATLDHASRRVGSRIDALQSKTNVDGRDATTAAGLGGIRDRIRGSLDEIPEFAEANLLSHRMNERLRALDAGYSRGVTGSGLQMADEVAPWQAMTPLDLPPDIAAEASARLGRPLTALPSPMDDYTAGAQARRVDRLRRSSPQTAVGSAGKQADLDALAFGPEGQQTIGRIGRQEGEVLRTTHSSPSARGQLNAAAHVNEALENAQALGSAGRHAGLAVWNPKLGVALGAMDILRLGAIRATRPSERQLAAEFRGLLAPRGGPAESVNRLIDQTRRQLDTPLHSGLFNASLYGGVGIADR
jgi:hypothetical protein